MEPTFKIIGRIQSSLKKIEDCPLQETENAPEAWIEIFPEFGIGVKDIKVGSKIILLTWLDKANRSILQCQPRNDKHAPMTGVFSTRSPDRPNPIGLHTAKVISVSNNHMIKVSGLEVLDQTPLLDLKPVLGNYDD